MNLLHSKEKTECEQRCVVNDSVVSYSHIQYCTKVLSQPTFLYILGNTCKDLFKYATIRGKTTVALRGQMNYNLRKHQQ